MQLPEEFIRTTKALFGPQRFARYLAALDEEPPVSIRLNPQKTAGMQVDGGERVAWCEQGWYLPRRPNFTFDPLLHAGCYYVQEASSMFLAAILRQHLPKRPVRMLDLCAAPGGKSTLALSMLPEGSLLYANEPNRTRANILLENIAKWGGHCIVTSTYPRDYQRSGLKFDVVLCDVPCSGEGMFRKDAATIGEWSPRNVEKCARLQREIVTEAMDCLVDGGLFIYSTCTFNILENEENIRWMLETFNVEALHVETQADWGITGSLLEGFTEPVYRFIPGISRGEGLFMCAMRGHTQRSTQRPTPNPSPREGRSYRYGGGKDTGRILNERTIYAPLPGRGDGGKASWRGDGGEASLSYAQAMAYLRGEALVLSEEVPKGLVTVGFQGHALGPAKNIGTRANNLYPKEWRIKSTHIPQDYEPILTAKQSASHAPTELLNE